jgi:hypothetical protein
VGGQTAEIRTLGSRGRRRRPCTDQLLVPRSESQMPVHGSEFGTLAGPTCTESGAPRVAAARAGSLASPTPASTDPLGQGHDDSVRSTHIGHAPDMLVLTHAANQAVAVRGQSLDGRLKVVHLERHVAQP